MMRVTNPSVFTKQATCTADTARKKNLRLALRKISLNDFCPHRTSSMGDLEGLTLVATSLTGKMKIAVWVEYFYPAPLKKYHCVLVFLFTPDDFTMKRSFRRLAGSKI